jgi:hypothetical protein
MRLADYFFGVRRQLHSPAPPRIIADRINAAAGSALWPFTSGVVGGVWLGHLRLRFRTSLFEYNAKPVLVGRVRETPSGSCLHLNYRAPAWVYAFDLVWYGFLGFVVLLMLGQVGARNPDLQAGELFTAWAILILLLIAPLVMHYLGTRRSNEDLECLLEFLSRQANAVP